MNGDGIDEIVIGAPNTGEGIGVTGVFFGSVTLGGEQLSFELADALLWGRSYDDGHNSCQDFSGDWVAGAGDFNGDGFDDLLVGAPNTCGSDALSGRAYLLPGGSLVVE